MSGKDLLLEFDRKTKLSDCAIEALLLGYTEPIKPRFPIPYHFDMAGFTIEAVRKLCGDGAYNYEIGPCICVPKNNVLEERVMEGIRCAIERGSDEDSNLGRYLLLRTSRINSDWFNRCGQLYTFKPEEREKAEQRIREFWNEKELADFNKINEITRELAKIFYAEKLK